MFDFCNLRVRQKTLSQNRILACGNKCSPEYIYEIWIFLSMGRCGTEKK